MNGIESGTWVGPLPVKHDLAPFFAFSGLIALLMTLASLAGLLFQSSIYPTDELRLSFVPNDVVNLVIGLPVLLGSMGLAWRGKLIGLLFWPGALLYVLYMYIVYLVAAPFNSLFLAYLTLVMLSVYTLISLLLSIDGEAVYQRLRGVVSEKIAGGVLAGLALLFFLRVIGVVLSAIGSQEVLSQSEIALLVADFTIAPAQFIGGILLWQRKTLGYVGGVGLLFQASMLFIGLIFILLLQPLLTAAPINMMDILVVFVMGMICFIPFGLFLRGVLAERRTLPSIDS